MSALQNLLSWAYASGSYDSSPDELDAARAELADLRACAAEIQRQRDAREIRVAIPWPELSPEQVETALRDAIGRRTIDPSELADLRAKAARCDEYERPGEALIADSAGADEPWAPKREVRKQQLARCRVLVGAALIGCEFLTPAQIARAVTEALK